MRTIAAAAMVLAAATARAEVKTETASYQYEGTTYVGHLAYDDAVAGKRPAVLVFHEWWGLDDFAKNQAERLAKLGYVAFAADMYGNGKVVDHPKDSNAMVTAVRSNQENWRGRARAALKVLTDSPRVDATSVAAIGYCFGGTTALQLALSGADLKAISTFHAALPKVSADEAKAIKARVMVHHGGDDKFIPEAAVTNFKAALTDAKVALEFFSYPGAVHSFAVPNNSKTVAGMAYDAAADEQSWARTLGVFEQEFRVK